ncbi:hypothetical protein L208DRAFT_505346 [Tricholoma matsutake]|nr:hypothetical protein L208DRAFT_505346 [Tricholoma matsutake 945]
MRAASSKQTIPHDDAASSHAHSTFCGCKRATSDAFDASSALPKAQNIIYMISKLKFEFTILTGFSRVRFEYVVQFCRPNLNNMLHTIPNGFWSERCPAVYVQ